jgi:hypothetical protein
MSYVINGHIKTLQNINLPPETKELIAENVFLKSLVGCPTFITKFKLKGNLLTDFRHLPVNTTHIDISDNNISSLMGCPANVTHLKVSSNNIKSLKGCPDSLQSLDCSYTHITTFDGVNPKLQSVVASFTQLNSMKGLPKTMKNVYIPYNYINNCLYCPNADVLDISNNRLTNLDGCKEKSINSLICNNNMIKTQSNSNRNSILDQDSPDIFTMH